MHQYQFSNSNIFVRGFGTDSTGRFWRWEFSPWFGPEFLRADWLTWLVRFPAEKNPVWDMFYAWLDKVEYGHMWR